MFNFKNDPNWSFFEPARFIIAGIISSSSSLVTIFILVSCFNLWPVWGTIMANIVSGLIGFTLHKIWTFGNKSPQVLRQAFFYFFLIILNLFVSALAMYILNDILHIWYFFDQILIILVMATFNYLFDRTFIFVRVVATH